MEKQSFEVRAQLVQKKECEEALGRALLVTEASFVASRARPKAALLDLTYGSRKHSTYRHSIFHKSRSEWDRVGPLNVKRPK